MRRGFTLIELLVVIAVIGLLIGIIAVGTTTAKRQRQESATRLTLHSMTSLESVAREQVNIIRNRPTAYINHDGTAPIDWREPQPTQVNGYRGPELVLTCTVERFVAAAWMYGPSRDLVEEMALDRVSILVDLDNNGYFEARDVWGRSLEYRYDPAVWRRPYFISAGPSGDFDVPDNITSIDMELE